MEESEVNQRATQLVARLNALISSTKTSDLEKIISDTIAENLSDVSIFRELRMEYDVQSDGSVFTVEGVTVASGKFNVHVTDSFKKVEYIPYRTRGIIF